MSEVIKKKRGRKPKNAMFLMNKPNSDNTNININTEEENIICHLPITIDEINNDVVNDIFIKDENKQLKLNLKVSSTDTDSNENIKTSFIQPNQVNSVNKIITHTLDFTKKIKCFWCKNYFDTESLQRAKDYYNDTFYCEGNYCSYNCKISYTLDENDSQTWKIISLIHLMFYKTYGKYIEIIPAPHWTTLQEYGGPLTLSKFRENFLDLTKEYTLLQPPLISRQMQIEESYRSTKLKEVPIDKINKIYSEIETEYVLKRSKPIQTSHLNLMTTMGLTKIKKK